jgi:hypothetical protein
MLTSAILSCARPRRASGGAIGPVLRGQVLRGQDTHCFISAPKLRYLYPVPLKSAPVARLAAIGAHLRSDYGGGSSRKHTYFYEAKPRSRMPSGYFALAQMA